MTTLASLSLFGYDLLDTGAVTLLILLTATCIKYLVSDIKAKDALIKEIQDERRNDAVRNLQVLEDVANTVNKLVENLYLHDGAVKSSFDSLSKHLLESTQRLEDIIHGNK